jgi:hypothetical protein
VPIDALERDQLLVDEASDGFAQNLDFFGKIEVHSAYIKNIVYHEVIHEHTLAHRGWK